MKLLISFLFALAALSAPMTAHPQAKLVVDLGTLSGNGPHVSMPGGGIGNYSFTVPIFKQADGKPGAPGAAMRSRVTVTSDPNSNGGVADLTITVWGGNLKAPVFKKVHMSAASTGSLEVATLGGTKYQFSLTASNPIGFALVVNHGKAPVVVAPRR